MVNLKNNLCLVLLPALFLLTQPDGFTQIRLKMPTITGEYYLSGVMETASVIRLNADSSFQFYYAYGASDREGSGTWTLHDSTLILNSKPRPLKDFRLIESSFIKDADFTISFSAANPAVFPFLACQFTKAGNQFELKPDNEGFIKAPPGPYTAIGLLFVLCGDRPTWFSDLKKEHNNFRFEIESWICEVFFNNIRLTIKEHSLVGQHPLLPGNRFTYQKQD